MLGIVRLPPPAHLISNGYTWTIELCEARKLYYQELSKYKSGILKNRPKTADAMKSRYGHPSIKAELKRMFGKKCCYCESEVDSVSYKAVEHFRPQSIYPSLAYDWNNLLLACEMCNSSYKKDKFLVFIFNSEKKYKQSLNNKKNPCVKGSGDKNVLIDPTIDNPTIHFDLTHPVPKPLTLRALVSLEVYGLDRDDLEDQRKMHIQKIIHYINTYNRALMRNDKLTIASSKKMLRLEYDIGREFSGTTRALMQRAGIRL